MIASADLIVAIAKQLVPELTDWQLTFLRQMCADRPEGFRLTFAVPRRGFVPMSVGDIWLHRGGVCAERSDEP